MDRTIKLIWNSIIDESEKIAKNNKKVVLYEDAYDVFKENFYYFSGIIKNNFMKDKSSELDRHKVAAIIICSVLNNDLLGVSAKEKDNYKNYLFLANEKVAVNVALSYMYEELKIAFQNKEVPYNSIFEKYVFPTPYSCNRGFDEVICRDLYYTKKHFMLNPISLANFLFLVEDYSFTAYKIKRTDLI